MQYKPLKLNPLRHQCSSTNFTWVTKRFSQVKFSQLLGPTTYIPQLSQTRTSNWRRLVHKQISDCDVKIHPRIYSGTIYCLLVVPCPAQMHSLHSPEPILTTLNNFLPPNGSKVYNSQSIAEEIFDPILEYLLLLHVLSHHKVISLHTNHFEK